MATYGFTIYRAYVLYWMQMYLRGSDNAALDEAIRQANRLGLPLLVYQGLNPDYPEANDRIHTFIIECARDVARELAERGIASVPRPGGGARLTDQAAIVSRFRIAVRLSRVSTRGASSTSA